MPNVGDIIRASDVAIPAGSVIPFYNVTLSGRYPIFWGKTEVDTGWLVCDGGDDLHGGTVPDLTNKFIMGCISIDEANQTGGSSDITVGNTTLTANQMPSHTHSYRIFKSGYTGAVCVWSDSAMYSYGNATSTGGSQSHTHSFSGTFTPPYYSLNYLVKLPSN